MWGYDGFDDLGGEYGRDKIRGGGGDDDLTDGKDSSDEDRFCDGNGSDFVMARDGDGQDELYITGNDGEGFTYDADFDRGDGSTPSALNCPL